MMDFNVYKFNSIYFKIYTYIQKINKYFFKYFDANSNFLKYKILELIYLKNQLKNTLIGEKFSLP